MDGGALRDLAFRLPVMVKAFDADGNVIAWNAECERATGYAAGEILDNPRALHVLYADAGIRERVLERWRAREDWQADVVSRQGRARTIAWTNMSRRFPIPGWHFWGIGRDVTEQAARDEEKEFRAIYEQAAVGIAQVGLDGRWLRVNGRLSEILGYDREELEQLSFQDTSHPAELEANLQLYRSALAGEIDTYSMEKRYIRRNGDTVWADLSVTLVRDAGGRPKYFISVIEDITERKRAEELLRVLAESPAAGAGGGLFATLARQLARCLEVQCVVVAECLDAPPTRVRTLALWNGGHLEDNLEYTVDGTPCEEVVNGRMVFYPSGVQERFPGDTILVEMGVDSYCGLPLVGRSGAQLGHMAILDEREMDEAVRDNPVLRIFAARATAELERKVAGEERERLEEQVRHSQKLESLGILAGGIAHDFNNLLMGVLGNAGLALSHLEPGSPHRRFVEQIEKAATRAAELTQQMLAYSGKGRFDIRSLDLSALVYEMADLLAASVSKKAELGFHLAGDLPAIEGDATQIRQVVMNLVTNASEAVGDRPGVISVGTTLLECDRAFLSQSYMDDDLPEGPHVCLEVRDTGCGMDPETRARMFDPFFTTKFTGRGLGMAVVLGIVRGHRAAVLVESEPNEGSSLRILFPVGVSAPPVREAAPVTAEAAPVAGTILVVDDEEIVRSVARGYLEQAGFEVVLARDGREGLEALRDHGGRIALVLLDLTMPRLGGEEVYRAMRKIRPDMPILLSSGYDEQTVQRRFASEEFAGFIQKPYRAATLRARIRDVLAR